ncbi:amidohydrolase family protein [Flammeovirgaceae bacterium SG7u.111]|nr:amidohydrolase family protein [Flammeovirgaceae bacterium SG7u.132]WPO35261.1 amidohydrolase family protein [Flammeovirgaceae bacterium SG7u.111]
MKKYSLLIVSLFLSLAAFAQVKKGSVLIKNGTVITITNGILENTDVLIEDGIISKIGKDLKAKKEMKTIDATGQFVMPGIIDAHSHIALTTVNEWTSPVTADVWVGDALDPLDINIYQALAGGVTISHAMHGSANVIGGQNETIKHRWGVTDPELIRMEGAPRTIKCALGENPTRVHGRGFRVRPGSRMGVEEVFRESFSLALEYQEAWKKYEADKASGVRSLAPEYNYRLQTLVDVIEGEVMIHCHSYRADEILMLMNVCKDFGIDKICFQHVNEGFKVAPELAEFGAMASVFADWWAYKFEVYYSTAFNAAILSKNGVITSINSDSGELIRHLYHEAGKTQRYGGLTDEEALKLITINPAIQLGIDKKVGSLEEGKQGDVVIFNAHPLSVYAIPQKTLVDGVVYFDIENDADDMRIFADPEQVVEEPVFANDHDHDSCMEGAEQAFQFLFMGKSK